MEGFGDDEAKAKKKEEKKDPTIEDLGLTGWLHHFAWRSSYSSYRILRFLFHIPAGIAFGLLVWEFAWTPKPILLYGKITRRQELNQRFPDHSSGFRVSASIFLAAAKYVIVLIAAIAYTVTPFIRCMIVVFLPTFFGKTGLNYLKTQILGNILDGPNRVLSENIDQFGTAMACNVEVIKQMGRNMTVVKPTSPTEKIEKLNKEQRSRKILASRVRSGVQQSATDYGGREGEKLDDRYFEPSRTEQEREAKADGLAKELTNNLVEEKCRNIKRRAYEQCLKGTKYRYEKCKKVTDKFRTNWLTRSIVKQDNVCGKTGTDTDPARKCEDVLSGKAWGVGSCADVNNSVGRNREQLKNLAKDILEELDDLAIDLKYRISFLDIKAPTLMDFAQLKEDMKQIFRLPFRVDLSGYFSNFLELVKLFLVLRSFYKAFQYVKKYRDELEHDNEFLTHYFYKIEKRRRTEKRMTVIPVLSFQKKNFTKSSSSGMSKDELKIAVNQAVQLMVLVGIACASILVASKTYKLMVMFKQYETVVVHRDFHQSAGTKIDFPDVKKMDEARHGEPEESSIFRRIKRQSREFKDYMQEAINNFLEDALKKMRLKVSYAVHFDNKKCALQPKPVPTAVIQEIRGTAVILSLLCLFSGFILRLRFAICAFFFPARQKQRILWRYNAMLKDRVAYMEYRKMRLKGFFDIKDEAFKSGPREILVTLLKGCGYKKASEFARHDCGICKEVYAPSQVRECTNAVCNRTYCRYCWSVMKKECFDCGQVQAQ